MRNILFEIIEKRKNDIERLGYDFGFDVPKQRQRPIHPFLLERGAILEIKRASPSKGDIAPALDPASVAIKYAESGAKAISCLTEMNYFKGSLLDFMSAASALDSFCAKTGTPIPALLRKDFLLCEEDIDVSYRAGADAVLLIARILDEKTICNMAKSCAARNLNILLEVRKEDDLEKLAAVLSVVDKKYVVAGVNSRDLKNFSIDTLIPASLFEKIVKIGAQRIVFESGILTPEAASFASSLGFHAILLGEAAAKNPTRAKEFVGAFEKTGENANGKSWREFSTLLKKNRPFVKICGLTQEKDALLAAELGADMIGFVFHKKSKRFCTPENAQKIISEVKNRFGENAPKAVAVIVDKECEESRAVFDLARRGVFWKVQFHGNPAPAMSDEAWADIPRYSALRVSKKEDAFAVSALFENGEPRVLIDSFVPDIEGGTGERIASDTVSACARFGKLWLAGGINPQNALEMVKKFNPELIDCASGVEESPGIKSAKKMRALFDSLLEGQK